MFTKSRKTPVNAENLENIEAWTRKCFALSRSDIVLVSEQQSRLPGFSSQETIVTFFDEDKQRYRFRIFKPAALVKENDIPINWMKQALIDDGSIECC